MDDRGRVTIPSRIRQELNEKEVILARGFEECIFGYDRGSWEREAGKQLEAPVTDQRAREMRRYLFAGAVKAEVDKLGRILLPAQLKEYGFITQEVMIVGAGDHFEIWDKKKWETYSRDIKGV